VADHYAAVARATGKPVQQAPTLAPEMRPLWWTFIALHRARSGGGMGENPIQFTEIEAWCRLSRVALEPWEVDVIGLLDDAYLESTQE
jgi:hypothetical protein